MKAYIYVGNRELRLVEKDPPRAQHDTAVMRVQVASICGTDLRTYRHGSERIVAPRVIGHEACGVIEEVGPGIQALRPGQRVMVVPAVGCGACRWCKKGSTNMCERLRTVGFDFDGAFAEFMEIPAQALAMGNVLVLPESVSDEQAALAEPVACCANGQGYLHIGTEDFVFIFGAGYIGCIHAELALKKQARRVVLSDVSQERLTLAASLLPGVDTVDTARVDPVAYVRDLTEGRGADVIVTACPSGDAHSTATKMAATRARISLFGGIAGSGFGYLDSNAIHYAELSLFGSHASTVAQNRQVLDWIAAGKVVLDKYVSTSYPLERIEEAFEALKSERVLKVQIRPDVSRGHGGGLVR